MSWLISLLFWLGLAWAVVCLVACVLFLLILIEDWLLRRAQLARAQARYEVRRDAEAERMELIRRHLDENWSDEEDPLSERAADEAIRHREERADFEREGLRWLATLPEIDPRRGRVA